MHIEIIKNVHCYINAKPTEIFIGATHSAFQGHENWIREYGAIER
jgi:hypothetical protein